MNLISVQYELGQYLVLFHLNSSLQMKQLMNLVYAHMYSGISIYRSCNNRFPACIIRHFWSRMKFHINNVIYSRIHRSLNYRFTALIICKSRS